MNHLSGLDRLANNFSVMRHGQSKANVEGIIVSRVENDRSGDYGLTELGRKQALTAAQGCGLPAGTLIFSSDFARARQTARIVRDQLGAVDVVLAQALRERCFGAWEGTSTDNYARVWAADEAGTGEAGATQPDGGQPDGGQPDGGQPDGGQPDGVEPASAVLDRATALVADLERRYSGRDILLVSHGDTLQILQAGFLRMDPSRHRSLPALETAEIRQLRLSPPPRT